MRVLILNWRDIKNPLSGGAEISLFEHAKYWVKQHNVEVLWFCSSFPGAKKEEKIHGINFIRRGTHYTVHVHAFFYFLRYLRNKMDIIIDNFHFIPFFTPVYARREIVIAFINEPAKNVWFKNINFFLAALGYIFEPFFFIPYRKKLFLTGSDSIAKELLEYQIPDNQIKVIPHGVRVEKNNKKIKKEKYPTFLYLARIAEDKGIEDILKMLSIVKKEFSKIYLWIVGSAADINYYQKIKTLIVKLDLSHNVEFFGFVTEKEKFRLLQKSWILVHASIREGWGLTVIEANCFGVPAIGYKVSGLQDSIRDHETGLLTDKNTPEGLARSVLILLKNKKLYDTLSRNAITFSNNFSWEKSGVLSWRVLNRLYEEKTSK